jgi:1-deoxy-D-xylulose-5-phosphate synthase
VACAPARARPGHGKQLKVSTANPNYTAVFGKALAELMEEFPKAVAITAAMPGGTGTAVIAKQHPARFFDVGIAEGHGVTFAAGMATQGAKPVVAIYSTFLQRGYDNIMHDVAIQSCRSSSRWIARARGRGRRDAHGALRHRVHARRAEHGGDRAEGWRGALGLLRTALAHENGPFAFRYPRDVPPDLVPHAKDVPAVPPGTWEVLRRGEKVAILAVGTMVGESLKAADALAAEGLPVTVVNCRYLKPYDATTLTALLATHQQLLVVEEGTVVNGFGAFMASVVAAHDPSVRVHALGVPDQIVYAASRPRQLALCGIDAAGIAARVRALHETEALAG